MFDHRAAVSTLPRSSRWQYTGPIAENTHTVRMKGHYLYKYGQSGLASPVGSNINCYKIKLSVLGKKCFSKVAIILLDLWDQIMPIYLALDEYQIHIEFESFHR